MIRSWIFRTEGDIAAAKSYDALLLAHADHWLIREIRLYLKRVLKQEQPGPVRVNTNGKIGLS